MPKEREVRGDKNAKADDEHKDDLLIEADDEEETSPVEPDDTTALATAPAQPAATVPAAATEGSQLHRLWRWVRTHTAVSVPVLALVVVGILAAVPVTRYALAGLVVSSDFRVHVIDAQTGHPVSSATVTLAGKSAATNSEGFAILHVPVGSKKIMVTKKYYKDASLSATVPIGRQTTTPQIRIQATGRQVSVVVRNKISQKILANVVVKAGQAEAKTNKDGLATLVVPASLKTVDATFTLDGYNSLKQSVVVGETLAPQRYDLVPAGKVYFLSNKSGKIDIVKTNLDGSERAVVVEGTGKEDKASTSLLASRDWKYLALLAKRDSDKAKLYILDTSTDKLAAVDEGDANFTLVGWSGHAIVYKVERTAKKYWESKRLALKSYDATARKLTTLDENAAEGDQLNGGASEEYDKQFIIDSGIVYIKNWSGSSVYWNGKKATMTLVSADGKTKKTIKQRDVNATGITSNYIEARLYAPQEIYVMTNQNYEAQTATFEEYEDGQLKPATGITVAKFYQDVYPTYLISPSGEQSLWTTLVDGKQQFFTGNKEGKNEHTIGIQGEANAYGWYGDDYVFLSKKNSELYVAPRDNVDRLLKVADYYRPDVSYSGYGYGYGGL